MTNRTDFTSSSMSRRSLIQSVAAALSVPMTAKGTNAWAQDKLAGSGEVVTFSYGGSWTAALREQIYEPFTKATGIKVIDVTADYAGPQSKAMFKAGRVDWDFVILTGQERPEFSNAGMLAPIDYSFWDKESLDGVSSQDRGKDWVVQYRSSIVIAYDQRSFPKGGPQNWVDFWDVKRFPGPRGLKQTANESIPCALLADGVAHKDIYPLTDAKLDRAFKKLNELKPHIAKWWAANPETLLINGEYAACNAFDGATIRAIRKGAPIKLSWDIGFSGAQYSAILKGGPNTLNAQKLLAYLNRAEVTAKFTQATAYAGVNKNQLKYLPADIVPLLGILNPENASRIVYRDDEWLNAARPDGKTNAAYVAERWLAWRAQ